MNGSGYILKESARQNIHTPFKAKTAVA